MNIETQYLNTMRRILSDGEWRETRNGLRKTIFGAFLMQDLEQGYPLLTTKYVWFKGVAEELRWMLSGATNIKPLLLQGVHIWDKWAGKDGEVGKLYGYQWRNWDGHIDQLANAVESIQSNPTSSRHIVSAWNPSDIAEQNLPPCHILYQFDVSSAGRLNLSVYQRSADWFLGVPFNLASYALLDHIIADVTGLHPGVLAYTFANVHLYENQIKAAIKQLQREPYQLPQLTCDARFLDGEFKFSAYVSNYDHHPLIRVEVVQ